MFELNRNKQSLTIDNISYSKNQIINEKPNFADKSTFHNELYLFVKEWFDDNELIELQTSGSTGVPKKIIVKKMQMMQSSQQTCLFLKLQKDDNALLCMSLEYVGAKMLVVRALICGLNLCLVSPNGYPLSVIDTKLHFAAMVPLQVYNSLTIAEQKKRLELIDVLIIGGSSIDEKLAKQLRNFSNKIYSTYGMTETLSHIALRLLSGKSANVNYYPLPSIKLSLSKDDCLIIDAANICEKTIYTNDIAQIYADGSFSILGRKDNVINSAGYKIQVEEIEQKLAKIINHSFAITSYPDEKFGEILVLVIESTTEEKINNSDLQSVLTTYQMPKKIVFVEQIPRIDNGKINRLTLQKLCHDILIAF